MDLNFFWGFVTGALSTMALMLFRSFSDYDRHLRRLRRLGAGVKVTVTKEKS